MLRDVLGVDFCHQQRLAVATLKASQVDSGSAPLHAGAFETVGRPHATSVAWRALDEAAMIRSGVPVHRGMDIQLHLTESDDECFRGDTHSIGARIDRTVVLRGPALSDHLHLHAA